MSSGRAWLRRTPLLAVAALALHELRYLAEYGTRAPEELNKQGHSYLPFVEAVVLVALVAGAVGLARVAWRARRGHVPLDTPPTFLRGWAFSSVVLLAIYTLQEGIEGGVSPGHPGGLAGIYGHGGWTAIVLAIALGAMVAIALRGAHVALRAIARRASSARRSHPRESWSRPAAIGLPRIPALAGNVAGRAPPHRS